MSDEQLKLLCELHNTIREESSETRDLVATCYNYIMLIILIVFLALAALICK